MDYRSTPTCTTQALHMQVERINHEQTANIFGFKSKQLQKHT